MFDYSKYPDAQLLKMLGDSNQQAFTELYKRYHIGIYNFQLAIIKIPSISQDITQEVFAKIWEARKRIQIHTSFAAYIFRISRNSSIDFLKKIATERKLHDEIVIHRNSFSTDSTNLYLKAKEYRYLYNQAIDSLSIQQRSVFLLCKEEGKAYEEVALLLGISRHTVKEHMTNSLRKLRAFLFNKIETLLLFILFARLH